jgi:hypothetical protein
LLEHFIQVLRVVNVGQNNENLECSWLDYLNQDGAFARGSSAAQ